MLSSSYYLYILIAIAGRRKTASKPVELQKIASDHVTDDYMRIFDSTQMRRTHVNRYVGLGRQFASIQSSKRNRFATDPRGILQCAKYGNRVVRSAYSHYDIPGLCKVFQLFDQEPFRAHTLWIRIRRRRSVIQSQDPKARWPLKARAHHHVAQDSRRRIGASRVAANEDIPTLSPGLFEQLDYFDNFIQVDALDRAYDVRFVAFWKIHSPQIDCLLRLS
jgi:hypothetical protein